MHLPHVVPWPCNCIHNVHTVLNAECILYSIAPFYSRQSSLFHIKHILAFIQRKQLSFAKAEAIRIELWRPVLLCEQIEDHSLWSGLSMVSTVRIPKFGFSFILIVFSFNLLTFIKNYSFSFRWNSIGTIMTLQIEHFSLSNKKFYKNNKSVHFVNFLPGFVHHKKTQIVYKV